MPRTVLHDSGEAQENDERRDDGLENNQQVVVRDFLRGSDRDDEDRDLRRRMAEQTFANNQRLFEQSYQSDAKLNDLEARRRERAEVQTDDRSGLEFRDAATHSTAASALETSTAVAALDTQGEAGVAGAETEENTPDSDDSNMGVRA